MGLDTFAVTRGEDGEWHVAPDAPFEGLRLCDGWGSASIRGKVYAEVVVSATDESLYQERIEADVVAVVANRLRAAVEEAKRAGPRMGTRQVGVDARGGPKRIEYPVLDVAGVEIHAGEAEDLARWFEICAEQGYAVDGWW